MSIRDGPATTATNSGGGGGCGGPANSSDHDGRSYMLQIYPRLAAQTSTCCNLRVQKEATVASVISDVASVLGLDPGRHYVLAEVKECGGEEWVLEAGDLPVQRFLLWPRKAQEKHPQSLGFYFLLQERNRDGSIHYVHLPPVSKEQEAQRLAARGFLPPPQDDFADLCNLPLLNEDSILNNLRTRFYKKKIYTYAGSILIAINPFKFLPIYNPKYVKMYEKHQLGKLEPHIFAIADVAYYAMLRKRVNQCIVISGESGSGKTQSTNFLIHCLTALSQKGYASGVERTILGAGPVLEAFGNAKTAHNNNSSRFGKFIQVNYLEGGVVRGAVVEKYLLEKSRLVSREKNERNYHVFYYLLLGASEEDRKEFKLLPPEDYLYLKQQNFKIEDEEDLRHDFERLQQAMEMVGFLPSTKKQIFSVLSAILYLGNVTYKKKSTGRDEGLDVGPPEVLATLSDLLKVKEELLVEALTKRKTVTVNDKLILPYSHPEAITARDSMAKSLYSALFDWIVLRINHALLNKKDMEESVSCLSIGVLDIFGFEDFETNSFEQFCINYANEQLQYYFNNHIFTLEQEEYQAEGITWHNIDYTDNVGCIHLISKKPTGLLYLLDEESNFPHATDETLLAKFKQQHQGNKYFVPTPVMEPAFVIQHFAGRVKYQIKDFREKNTDHMRPDIVALLRSSDRAYVRQLIGMDPVAMFRWGILRATIRGIAAFNEAGRCWAAKTAGVVRPVSRTPLGELQRANIQIERMYKRASMLDFCFDLSEERPLEAFEDIFASFENKKEMHAEIVRSIKNLQLDGEDPRKLLQSWGRHHSPHHALQRSKTGKQKHVIPKNLLDSQSLKFIVSLTLQDRTTKSLLHLHKKKKPPSISAQFQTSLTKLLETLNRAEPFFIRCIRSNAEKKEMHLDESLVVQQLRYTGMLETVRIRRSGYGAKYTFQEFVEQFGVLLPKNATACKEDISPLLEKKMGLHPTTYQIGKTKVFLKELERQQLQDMLHKEVMRKIVFLQRWFRARQQRIDFLDMKRAAVIIQRSWHKYCRNEKRRLAATLIQAVWRGHRQRLEYHCQRQGATKIQALVRGHSARRRCQSIREEKRRKEQEEAQKKAEEEERRRRKEEEESRRKAMEEEERRRMEEEARRIAMEEEEAAKIEQIEQKKREEEEKRLAREPQTREDVDIELINEGMLDDSLCVQGTKEEREQKHKEVNTSSRFKEEQVKDKELDVELNGTTAEAGPQLERKEEFLDNQTPGWSDSKAASLSGLTSNALTPTSPDEGPDKQLPTTTSTSSNAELNRAIQRSQSSRSQEKREQRRRRGLEHNQRETERAASSSSFSVANNQQEIDLAGFSSTSPATSKDEASPPKSKPQEVSKLKERSDSKELDQYTFVEWKMKEDKGGKKEPKGSPSPPPPGPVRPSTLALLPAEPLPVRNGVGESEAVVTLQRRPGGMKEKPEKWKARRSEGEPFDSTSPPPPHDSKPQQMAESASSSFDSLSPGFEGAASKVMFPHEVHGDGARATSTRRKLQDASTHHDVAHLVPSTPDRSGGFLSKILKKRPHKEAQTPDNGDLTFAQIVSERPAGGEISTSGHQTRPLHQQHGDRGGKAVARNPSIKISRATRVSEQWNTSLDREITNSNELRHLDEFLGNQVNDFRSRGKQLSKTEAVFVTATMHFRDTLKDTYSVQKLAFGYKALMKSYQNQVIHLAGEEHKDEVQLVVNLFQSVLDGFIRGEIKKGEAEPAKPAKTRKKRRKKDQNKESALDHIFVNYQVNIMQSCDQCNSYIWVMEKAYMCSYCKMVCHKKCICKIVTNCYSFCAKKGDEESGRQHFGVHVCHVINDKNPVPMILEMMLEHVEIHGLYVEGIYRKSGSSNRMKELYQRLEADPHRVCLEDYPIHTVTGLVKQWLRELPDPLMTFTRYNDFLHAVELPEKQEQLQAIYKVLEELPSANFNTLERLVFHLVRVYKEETHNRMSPNSLAIVFAPCILRCPDTADPLLSMKDVAKTTMCVEMLINEQIRRYNETMEKIKQVESEEADAQNQLKLKRQNTHCQHLPLRLSTPYKGVVINEKARSGLSVVPEKEPQTQDSDTETEENIKERIEGLMKQKEDLVRGLVDMEQPGSDQENLDSEASLSSESLLDERQRSSAHNSEPEGLRGSPLQPYGPVCQTEPSSQAEQAKVPDGRVSLPNLSHANSTSSMTSWTSSASESSNSSLRRLLQRRNPIIPDTVKLPSGILSQSAASGPTQTFPSSGNGPLKFLVRRREQPGRRKDSTQSLYIDNPEPELLLHFSSCPPSASSSSSSISMVTRAPQHLSTQGSKGPRRFSDPDVPYVEEDV
ncbi:unconventional myosin-IXb isoform X2 [Betta splendens]|uniref:Unconventional myosin-IXb isoform X2 n=1 Tax=Betta splendens TaxID=158456 RepID=A0A6P7M7K4_BETSP|nr:unconventional myosin-IXb isoform X2 [Betta splendens]